MTFPRLPSVALFGAAAVAAVAAAALLSACHTFPPRIDTSAVVADTRPLPLPEGWQHGAFMEVFVRAYQDSDGDGIGDLRGLTSRLDYLKDLGVRGLWLMPITASSDRDHGYATTDFRALEPQYGTLRDFDEFIRQANARGIGVIVDYVINHASAEHKAFVDARRRTGSPFRSWFVWSEEMPSKEWDIWGKYPWYHTASEPWHWRGEVKDMPLAPAGSRGFYFGTFGPHMPDFNLRNPQVLAYHEDSLRFWLNRGLAGFRLDAVPHMVENNARDWNDQPESRALTKRLQTLVESYGRRWVVCEATAEPAEYAREEVCGAAFAFGYVHHFVEAARGKPESVQRVAEYYLTAPHTLATFVSNHDRFAGARLWDQVQGDVAMYRLAAAGYLLQPGTPFIYYGEEVGQPGVAGLSADPQIRGPMSWAPDAERGGFTTGTPFRPVAPLIQRNNAETQARDPQSIHAFYRAMLALRNQHPSIARGSYEAANAQGLVATWQRKFRGEHTVVAINYGKAEAPLRLAQLPPGARLASSYPQGLRLRAAADGTLSTTVPAQGVQVYVVNP
jgi:alpha-amylase